MPWRCKTCAERRGPQIQGNHFVKPGFNVQITLFGSERKEFVLSTVHRCVDSSTLGISMVSLNATCLPNFSQGKPSYQAISEEILAQSKIDCGFGRVRTYVNPISISITVTLHTSCTSEDTVFFHSFLTLTIPQDPVLIEEVLKVNQMVEAILQTAMAAHTSTSFGSNQLIHRGPILRREASLPTITVSLAIFN